MRTKKPSTYIVTGTVWLYPGESANWHFFTIPKKESAELKETFKGLAKGWGSLPVDVTIGKTTWKTSIFPDNKSGTYMLPIKAQVRRREELFDGDSCTVSFSISI